MRKLFTALIVLLLLPAFAFAQESKTAERQSEDKALLFSLHGFKTVGAGRFGMRSGTDSIGLVSGSSGTLALAFFI